MDQGAITLVLANRFERVNLPTVWAWTNAFHLSPEFFASPTLLLRPPTAVSV